MRLNEIEITEIPATKQEIFDSNKVWVIPVHVCGTAKIYSREKPTQAWIELNKGDHTIADSRSDIIFDKLENGEWLAMVESFGTVTLKGLPSLNACEDILNVMTPILWTSVGWEFLEKPSVRTCGSITTIDLDTQTIYKLVRNYSTGEFAGVDGYMEQDQ
jgi:hypothetical protein